MNHYQKILNYQELNVFSSWIVDCNFMKSGHRMDLLMPWQTRVLLFLGHPLGLVGPHSLNDAIEILSYWEHPWNKPAGFGTIPFLSSLASPSLSHHLGLAILHALQCSHTSLSGQYRPRSSVITLPVIGAVEPNTSERDLWWHSYWETEHPSEVHGASEKWASCFPCKRASMELLFCCKV